MKLKGTVFETSWKVGQILTECAWNFDVWNKPTLITVKSRIKTGDHHIGAISRFFPHQNRLGSAAPHPMRAIMFRNERNTFNRTVRELRSLKAGLTSEGLLTHACLGWHGDNCRTWNVRVSVSYVLVPDHTVNINPPGKGMVSASCSFPVGVTTNCDLIQYDVLGMKCINVPIFNDYLPSPRNKSLPFICVCLMELQRLCS